MAFIVIEGDNGTGKDTLAEKLSENGYSIISYLPDVKKYEKLARTSVDKTRAFLDYNNYCGNLAKDNSHSIVVRYWISTLAAAYADHIYEYDKVLKLTDAMKKTMVAPNVVIRVNVESETRLNRIALRNINNPELSDDVTIDRSRRYEWISKEILDRSGYRWREFDNTRISVEKLTSEVLGYINREVLNE
ncbi:hypothetical protein QYZ88_007665 [Lachnospiraceae bacterium C1.1]|nr:hypothetical protein [Lachnospiraceae bacterium C1.1]